MDYNRFRAEERRLKKRLIICLLLIIACLLGIRMSASAQDSWVCIFTQTDENHTVFIDTANIAGFVPLNIGDTIGVFFIGDGGYLKCGGKQVWNGSQVALAAFGNDDGLGGSGVKDGFADNEYMHFKAKQGGGSWNLYPSFSTDWDSVFYIKDGISVVTGISLCLNQTININAGWNIISSYVKPLDNDMSAVFAGYEDSVIIVKDEKGSVYFPSFSFNGIGDWKWTEGYKVKAWSDFELVVGCNTRVPVGLRDTLTKGVHLIAALTEVPVPTADYISDIDSVAWIKDITGDIYFPSLNFGSLDYIEPSRGYKIKMLAERIKRF